MLLLWPCLVSAGGGCSSWCHWDDANCEKEACEDCLRCKQLGGPPAGQPALVQKSTVGPNDPLLEYSGYVHLQVTSELATFDRLYSDTLGRNPAAKENPGARVRWRTDAQRVVANLDYREQCDELDERQHSEPLLHVQTILRQIDQTCSSQPRKSAGSWPRGQRSAR